MKKFLKPFLFICLGLVITTIVFASIVLERPSPPREPNVNDITATSCKISYKAPLSDGGSPIITYIIECRYEDSPKWINKGGSKELEHTVINMRENSTARFRIKAINSVGESDPVETGDINFVYKK